MLRRSAPDSRNDGLAPFRHPAFRRLWLASLATNLGGLIQAVGAAWMMTTMDASPAMVALVQGSITLPIMLFSLLAGVLADGFDRRRVMLFAQCFMLVVSVALTVCALLGVLTPWTLLSFTFLIGCGTALHNPSWQASIGDIVPRDDVPAAVTLNGMGFNLMRSIGPAVGGAIVAVAGAAVAFALNAVSYLAIIFALWRWPGVGRSGDDPREPFGSALSAGLRYVAMSPALIRVIVRGFLFGGAAVAVLALLPLVARDLLGGGALTYGLLLGAFGAGAVGGALSASRLRARMTGERLAEMGFLGLAVCAMGIAVSPSPWLTGAVLLLGGASWVTDMALFNATLQLSTPRWVVGRAIALYQTGVFGGMALGSWIWGQLAEAAGLPVTFFAVAVLLALGAMAGRIIPLPEYRRLDLQPLDRFREPPLKIDVTDRSGPIMVIVTWHIAEPDVPAFLALMAERRRIRRRDGAQAWVILRDLEDPDVWAESYHVPTWADYRRHNQRRTRDDARVYDELVALNRDGAAPVVQRMIERHAVPRHADMPRRIVPHGTGGV